MQAVTKKGGFFPVLPIWGISTPISEGGKRVEMRKSDVGSIIEDLFEPPSSVHTYPAVRGRGKGRIR